MSKSLLALLVAAMAGAAMAVQGTLNSVLGKVIGLLEATFVVHIVGTAVILGAILAVRRGFGDLTLVGEAPWYTYLGGALGVVIIISVAFSIPRTGVANATTAIIVGQVLAALLIDHFGLFGLKEIPFTWGKGIGLVFLAAGGYFLLCR